MIIRELDSNGDWTFGKGINNYLSNNDAIGLNINTRINSWVNDCFFDLPAGIDWYNRLGSKGQQALLELEVRRIIQQSYGVTGLRLLNITLGDTRNISISYIITTIFSPSYEANLLVVA